MTEYYDTIIVGGGQAGLAVSYWLAQQGRDHVILEKAGQPAEAWRNHRWDSFTLVTPNWMTRMPGAEYAGADPDGFMPRDQIVTYFEDYIQRFKLPIQYGHRVDSVEAKGERYLVRNSGSAFEAANVVMATGLFQQPWRPPFSAKLTADVKQFHSSEYRNPGSLPPGAVLVVGSAQSGCQIAEELYQSGRTVYLSVSRAGRIPRRYRGRDMTWWLDRIGFMDRTADMLPSPKARFAANPHASGARGGHTINLHQFARDGVVLLGRIDGMRGTKVALAPDLKANLAGTDKFEAEVLKQVDDYVTKQGLKVNNGALPKLRDGYDAREIRELDIGSAGITSVVWATGYRFDFGLVKLPVFDGDGYPVQRHGATSSPGLYFVGLPWLHTMKSGLLYGVGDDADSVASHIAARR